MQLNTRELAVVILSVLTILLLIMLSPSSRRRTHGTLAQLERFYTIGELKKDIAFDSVADIEQYIEEVVKYGNGIKDIHDMHLFKKYLRTYLGFGDSHFDDITINDGSNDKYSLRKIAGRLHDHHVHLNAFATSYVNFYSSNSSNSNNNGCGTNQRLHTYIRELNQHHSRSNYHDAHTDANLNVKSDYAWLSQ